MRPFQDRRLDGTPRFRVAAASLPAAQRTRRANGKLVANGNSARGRRERELLREYSRGFEGELDERTMSLIRSTVTVCLELEALEDKGARGEVIDTLALNRLVNTHRRSLQRLEAMRRELSPPATTGALAPDAAAALKRLRQHLERLARQG
jgi:hypothetical protein